MRSLIAVRKDPSWKRRPPGWADLAALLALVGLLATVAWLGRGMWAPFMPGAPPRVDLSPWRLPYYAGRSLLRMFIALGWSLVFTLVVGSWAAKSPRARRIILPALDVLQSVPVLGFLSATVTFFIALAPGRLLGLELASIFAIFTSQVWNLTFAFYHSLVTLPREQGEAIRLYRLSGWQRFTHFELPAAMIPMVWNGMMSFGGGWFFLAASEAITVLNRELFLPGIGAYLAVAVRERDFGALGWALGTMAALIVLVDRGFWRPLVAWSERFKLEESRSAEVRNSRVLGDPGAVSRAIGNGRADRLLTLGLWGVLGLLVLRGAAFVATEVASSEAVRVVGLGALTLLRVGAVLALAAVVWTPVGVWIGLSPRVARLAQPVVQLLAAFPANFLFPFVTAAFVRLHWSLQWGGALLMMLGAQWYLLFNTIAGAMAIPNDLREMTRDFGLRGRVRWRALILPGIFPAWVTGSLTAAGGAWNASIVAEVVTWGDARLEATGLGAYITEATTAGDWPRIVLGVTVMSIWASIGMSRASNRSKRRQMPTRLP